MEKTRRSDSSSVFGFSRLASPQKSFRLDSLSRMLVIFHHKLIEHRIMYMPTISLKNHFPTEKKKLSAVSTWMMASFGSLWDNRRKDKQTKSNPFVVVNWPALLVLFIPFCFVNSPRSLSLPTGSFKHQLLFLSSLSLSLGKLKMVSMLGKKYKKFLLLP